jgi:hypothetical protein
MAGAAKVRVVDPHPKTVTICLDPNDSCEVTSQVVVNKLTDPHVGNVLR